MTLNQLRAFVAVAEFLNMRRASETLNLSQPAVSAAINALEQRSCVRLFHRIGGRLELTEAGHAFLPEAQLTLQRAQSAQRILSDLSGLQAGTLHFFASQTVATYWLPQHMAKFAAAHPAVKLSLEVGNTAQTYAAILSGQAELGFIEGQVEETRIVTQIIGGDQLGLYVAPDNSLRKSKPNAQQLRKAGWILREEGSGTRDHFASSMHGLGVDFADLDVRLELPSNGAVLNAVMGGNFVCAVSALAAESRLKAGMLARLDCDLPPRQFLLIYHSKRYLGSAAKAFKKMIEADGAVIHR